MANGSVMTKKTNNSICPHFEKTFSILGKKWNGLIIETLLSAGAQRFKDISGAIQKCSDRVLVERLKELENEGIVIRRTFSDSSLIQYELTQKGKELKPVMHTVHDWADKWC
ncbi:MarR family transcriptional regulator [Philodulcilactobacillus myokoensis]|uniref:MarR family transcriptional regulator n=1 Tax=Philodulcilactobacillus myokoensis TaxID=2929573 RepID=A0A9W6B0M6_9LACO|nr:helix-turn-helix domain-containing protein [Philodulcilactobacillus myokoensis]GLB46772.1 MarR family transcriptional regulator [Philodulcilactobacillus myokoensis]